MAQDGWLVQAYGIPEDRPVVLLHGFMQDATVWGNTAEALAVSHYVVAPTMVPEDEEHARLADFADSVHDVIVQTELHTHMRKVVLVGYSLGGRVAIEYARRHPETLAGLVIESAQLGPKSESERSVLEKRNLTWASQFDEAESIEDVVNAWEREPLFETQQSLNKEELLAQRKIRLRCTKDHLVWILRHAGAHNMPLAEDTRTLLSDLGIPVLYIAGLHDQKCMEEAYRIDGMHAKNAHSAKFACGHNVHLESPMAYAEQLSEFIAAIS